MVGSGCLIGGGGGWIFLCLGREKISKFRFSWKENSMFRFVFRIFARCGAPASHLHHLNFPRPTRFGICLSWCFAPR